MSEETDKIKNIPFVFIAGWGRSGTSLLQNMLNAHPNIAAPPESKFIMLLYARFSRIKKWTQKDIHRFVNHLYADPMLRGLWSLDKNKLSEALLPAVNRADYPLLCKMVYYQMRKDKKNIVLFSDKNPRYLMFMATLLKIFPDARFIHIVRDPRDNVYSCMKAFGNMNIILNAMRWTKSNRLIENVKKKMPDKFATVLYEELAATPEPVMEKLCRFLGVQYNPGMIENTTPGWLKNVIAKGEKYHEERIHSALTGPLNTTNIGMWKSGLNEYEVAVTAKITGQYAKKMYGYDMNTEHNDTAKIPFFAFVKAWVICYAWIMINRIKYKSFRLNYIYFKYRKWRKGDKLQMAEYF